MLGLGPDTINGLERCEAERTATPLTLLPGFVGCVAEVNEIWLQTLNVMEIRGWRIAGREVPMRATVGSTWEGIQNVLP